MSVHHLLAAQEAEYVTGFTPDRAWSTAAALLALAGVIIGGLALARSRRTGNRGGQATIALVTGLITVVNGGLVLATADGGPGTGNGIIGGYLAIVLGLVAAVLGGLARTRSRSTV